MKRAARALREWALTLLVLLAFLAVIVVALCLRAVYETVMLVPRVIRAERRPLSDIEPDPTCQTWGYEAASWSEHLVREDRESANLPRRYPETPWVGGYQPVTSGAPVPPPPRRR